MFQQMQTVLGVMQGQGQMQQQNGGNNNNNNYYPRNGGPGWRPYNGDGGGSYSRGGRRGAHWAPVVGSLVSSKKIRISLLVA